MFEEVRGEKVVQKKLLVKNKEISLAKNDYISLTDIAKFKDSKEANEIIRNWLSNSLDFGNS